MIEEHVQNCGRSRKTLHNLLPIASYLFPKFDNMVADKMKVIDLSKQQALNAMLNQQQ